MRLHPGPGNLSENGLKPTHYDVTHQKSTIQYFPIFLYAN